MNSRGDKVPLYRAPHSSNPRRRRDFSDEDDDAFAYKRQRTAIACNSCKSRKSRCNGERPTCGTCIELGFECVYRAPARAPNAQARELHDVKTRLQALEELLHTIGFQASHRLGDSQSYQNRPISPGVPPSPSMTEAPVGEFSQQSSAECGVAAGEDTVDGMGVITFADESDSGHFGLSSNSAFFGHITRLLESTMTTATQRNAPSQALTTNLSRPASPPAPPRRQVEKRPNPYILPAREDILKMIESFFSVTGMFFPFIHKRSVINTLEELDINNFRGVRKSWLCLLNAIMAIGLSLGDGQGISRKHRELESDVYFQRALILSPWTLSNTTNLETVQALVVMTVYLQGASRSSQTWKIHGLLVQAAYQMGIHANVKSPKMSPLEQEIRTRTWYMCFVLDRMMSVAYGRPPLIHNRSIQGNLPLDIDLDDTLADHEESDAPSIPTQTENSSCSLFLATIKLYCIQGDVIEELYNQNLAPLVDVQPDQLFSPIMKFDQYLSEWKRELNPIVSLVPVDELGATHHEEWKYSRSQTVLTIRYLSVRVLLYRRVVETLLDVIAIGNSLSEHSLPIAQALIQACINSAIAIIQIIRALGARNDMLPAWWFTVYHVFNASLMLFGVVCLQTLGNVSLGTRPPSELIQCMQIALEDLDVIGRDTRIVRRCSKYLRKMIQISSSLVQNHSWNQSPRRDASLTVPFLQYNNILSVSDGSIQSPWDADFGQFLINDDSNFLDGWADLVGPLSRQ
ncbi:Fungal specific transcription factor domain-containing protein [Cladophialophora immunda]|nr:Fungal specific transcription factor domain-containing protein [Cladophialophora immunda]